MGSIWGPRWTEQRTAEFRKLYLQGVSFSRIAAKFGVTREACAGKAMRMGLSKNDVQSKPKAERAPLQFSRPTAPMLPSMPDGFNILAAQRCTLLQLTNSICKWPFGGPQSPDFFFCGGNAVEGKPYCVQHCRMAYKARAA